MNRGTRRSAARILLGILAAVLVPACSGGGSSVGPPGPAGPPGPPGSGAGWSLLGNAGTVDGTDFLGTTDNVALNLQVNNMRGLRIEPTLGAPNVIGGYSGNSVSPGVKGATIGGGGAAGSVNTVFADGGTVGGGTLNRAYTYATIAGGSSNTATGFTATIAGGGGNGASGFFASVTGGSGNSADGSYSTVAGGMNNISAGANSFVAGGISNLTNADYTFAAGYMASAVNIGSFVWSDSTATGAASTGPNQFIARASGGFTFFSSTTATAGVTLPAGSGAWSSLSDRHSKENVLRVEGRKTLEKLRELPISTWNYKTQAASIRHLGPMAQDFHAAFQTGEDDTRITTLDAEGVALSAIQGLDEVHREETATLRNENAELRARCASLEARLEALEKKLRD